MLFLDRLDSYAVDALDAAVIEGITRVLGPQIWSNTVLCFTRGSEGSAPPGVDFEEHVAAREAQLRAAVAAGGGGAADMAVALIENSSQCPLNADGEKVLPGETPWIVDLMEKVVDVALNTAPFEYRPAAAAKAADPNRRRKWLIPLVLAAQVAATLIRDRVMDEDGCKGDASGPFDAQTVEERRAELQVERAAAAKAKRRQKERARVEAKPAAVPEASGGFDDSAVFDDEDDEVWE